MPNLYAPDYEEVVSPTLYYDRFFNMEAVKVLPGEYYVSGKDMVMVTVLGSCVAACIRDRANGIGGMNHFMLPGDGGDILSASARYGTYAMEKMINDMLKMGAKRANFEAKLFGGGNVLPGIALSNVGGRNAEFAIDYLNTEKISIVATDMLDVYPRKVYFFPNSGRVMVKKLRKVPNDTIVRREELYSSRLNVAEVQGDVELFDND